MKLIHFFVALAMLHTATATSFKPQNLTTGEFFTNPVGYSLDDLSLSWQLPLKKNGTAQTSYRIVSGKSPETLDTNPLWDSGKVISSDSVKVKYKGVPPESRQRIYWKVKVWDESGKESEWSDVAFFEAGLISNNDWQAKWISTTDETRVLYSFSRWSQKQKKRLTYKRKGVSPTYLRKDFNSKKPLYARLYITSKGIFQAYINGEKVSNDYWSPDSTEETKRIYTNTYDVTNLIKNGKNTIGAIIGDGWYAGRVAEYFHKSYQKKPELLAQLEITYKDGSKQIIATDESWQFAYGAIEYADIYDGQITDANKEPLGWNKPNFDASAWRTPAVENVQEKPLLEPRRSQTIVAKHIIKPISVNEISEGVFIFDFGQNMAGIPELNLDKKLVSKGDKIKIRYAEMLNKDGTMYTKNYRSAISTDYYTCRGGGETFEPSFVYHGYRYVELSGFAKGKEPTLDSIRSKALYNDLDGIGTFVCSNKKINMLQNNIIWGQRSNYFSAPTDCPQRDERWGWMGDAQVFTPTAAFNMNVNAFFSKWLYDVSDLQTEAGLFPNFAPFGPPTTSASWGDAGIFCPWEIYLAYGDKKILERNYEAMKKWLMWQKKDSKNFIRRNEGLGDWLQPSTTVGNDSKKWKGNTPIKLINTAYFAKDAEIMSKVAKLLNKNSEHKEFTQLSSDIKNAFIKEFVKADGTVGEHTQTGYLLTLAFDILPENMREKVFAKFIEKFTADKFTLDTGFVGTPLIAPTLARFGRVDLAHKLLQSEEYPSWIYSINQGATTMWERWNSYSHKDGFGNASMNSFNHYAYGAIGEYMYRYLAGIWHNQDYAGYKKISFAAKPYHSNMTFASATHYTPYGEAFSAWKFEGDKLIWTIRIPANSTGVVELPTDKLEKVSIKGMPAPTAKKFELPSGEYLIEIAN